MSHYTDLGTARRTELLNQAAEARRGAGFEINPPTPRASVGIGGVIIVVLLTAIAIGTTPVLAATSQPGGGAARYLTK